MPELHVEPVSQATGRCQCARLFFGFGALASGLSAVLLVNPGSPLEFIWRMNPRAHEGFLHMGIWAPLLMAAVCIACAASAYGFFAGRQWGLRLGVGLLLVNLVGDVANAALGIELRALVGVPVVALLIWYLTTRKVKAFFSQASRGIA